MTTEAAGGIIELKEDNVRAVEAMLYFVYIFGYDGSGNGQECISPMIFNAEVYSIADKYGILALKVRATEKFDKAVRTCWDMDDVAHAITEVYSSTPSTDRGLRDTAVEVAHEHISPLLEKDDFRGVLEEAVGFTADVTQVFAQSESSSLRTYHCPRCGNHWEALLPCCGYVLLYSLSQRAFRLG
ncbi:hypothetical protein ABVK25_002424 [Lepraria finkii]|uniref:BTB domain-containing protein n=1 Tax=Lepraria finkii TaxID=1340010 RepID=A0ABR4BHR1_9LECA